MSLINKPNKTNKRKDKKGSSSKTYKPNALFWKICPFCHEEIPCVSSKEGLLVFNRVYSKICNCGAYEQECPCCHKPTWYRKGIYKHIKNDWFNCGFEGEKR